MLAVPAAPAEAKLPTGFVGVTSEDALATPGAYRAQQMKLMKRAGVRTLRQTIDWSVVERKRGKYDFSFYDGFVGTAAKYGIRVMPILFNPPSFRSKRPKKNALRGTYPPRRNSDFARFARRVAKRYGRKGSYWRAHRKTPYRPVLAYQIWNEPNLDVYWRPKARASSYVKLLRTTRKAIRKVDRRAEIVSAGLPDSRSGIPLTKFIDQMMRSGASRGMDTLAVNPYAKTPGGVIRNLKRARRALNRRGGKRIEIRATEVGWSDNGPKKGFYVGRKHARYVSSFIRLAGKHRKSLRLNGFVYFNWRDAVPYPGGKDFWGLHTGLHSLDGKAKPALKSFRAAVRKLK
ncbi:beta-galactosidase [Paraconexibacter sp.]|uniref:beta-galactosidase n=1 Tax=Paraconexibacter sp. TaxID=2949640 RepID=UPI003567F4D1